MNAQILLFQAFGQPYLRCSAFGLVQTVETLAEPLAESDIAELNARLEAIFNLLDMYLPYMAQFMPVLCFGMGCLFGIKVASILTRRWA